MTGTKLPEEFRLKAFRALLIIVFLALVVQLWRLQIVQGDYYQEAADVNRFRMERTLAPRGVIYDQRGHLLARNMPRITVSIVPAYLPEDEDERLTLLQELASLLDMPFTSGPAEDPSGPAHEADANPEPGILDILDEAELAPYRPTPLKDGIPRDIAMILEEEHLDWPGVVIQVEPVREYLYGSLTSHILGYVGPIPAEQVQEYEDRGYDPNQHLVGLSGIEYSFEERLQGRDGQKLIEVDVARDRLAINA